MIVWPICWKVMTMVKTSWSSVAAKTDVLTAWGYAIRAIPLPE